MIVTEILCVPSRREDGVERVAILMADDRGAVIGRLLEPQRAAAFAQMVIMCAFPPKPPAEPSE